MYTQGPNVGASFAAAPKDHQLALLIVLQHAVLIDGADAQLALDCRYERRPLKQCSLNSTACMVSSLTIADTMAP